MLPTFVIGLREGLEAALIVGVIAAFLGRRGQRTALRQVWIGTAAAVAICVGVAVTLQMISSDLRHASGLKAELEDAAASALAASSRRALVAMAFLAVLREGFETAVFLLATFNASGDAAASWPGAWLVYLVPMVIVVLYRPRQRKPPSAQATAHSERGATSAMRTVGSRVAHRAIKVLAVVAGIAVVAAGCSSPHGTTASDSKAAKPTAVTIDLTPAGCIPKPARAPAGEIDFTVANKDASKVSEAELRTFDLSKILGEQENLTPGLSGGFTLNVEPGSYVINCPGASQQHWTSPSPASNPDRAGRTPRS